MSAVPVTMSHPFASGFTRGHGGPNTGGHGAPHWYIQYGMDLGATPGTEVRAAFTGVVSKYHPHVPARDSGTVFGAQIFVRGPGERMGAFYTHITGVPSDVAAGKELARGTVIGRVMPYGTAPHLHLALVEIIGGLPGGRYQGVDLYQHFLTTANTTTTWTVTFQQNGSPPVVGTPGGGQGTPGGGQSVPGGGGQSTVGDLGIVLGLLLGVQQALLQLGFDPGPIDGVDGPRTTAAVRACQSSRGLVADGIVGPLTRAALAAALTERGLTATGA